MFIVAAVESCQNYKRTDEIAHSESAELFRGECTRLRNPRYNCRYCSDSLNRLN